MMETAVNLAILVAIFGSAAWIYNAPDVALPLLGAAIGAYIGTELTHSIVGTALGLIVLGFFGMFIGLLIDSWKMRREWEKDAKKEAERKKRLEESAERRKASSASWAALDEESKEKQLAAWKELEREANEKK